MTRIIDTESKHRLSGKLTAGLMIAAMLALGAFSVPANADQRKKQNDWNRQEYRAPPVVYGSPYGSSYYGSPYYAQQYNYPPPVVYGPGIGVILPGITINIQ